MAGCLPAAGFVSVGSVIFTMNHTHFDESGKKIVLQGIRKDNKRFPGGWIEEMYRRYNAHMKNLSRMEYSKEGAKHNEK